MKKKSDQRLHGKGAVELIEEATHLLRLAPLETLFWYYIGTIPFLLALLFFWADMSRSADAGNRLIQSALFLAVLFLWMKCCQAVYAQRLRACMQGIPASPLSAVRLAGMAGVQAAVMPWGLVVLPAALLVTLPFGWCWAFYQNMTVLEPDGDLRTVSGKAWRQAGLWPAQNHLLFLIISLSALAVFANLAVGMFLIPRLLRSLLGVETMFARSNQYLFNSTFWCILGALTYLCIDPLVKAVYLLRCHYGESLQTGADLLTELRGLARAGEKALILALLALSLSLLVPCGPASAGESGGKGVSAAELDRSIERVIGGVEYAWRLPRQAPQKTAEPPGFFAQAVDTMVGWLKAGWRWVEKFFAWLADLLPKPNLDREPRRRSGWGGVDPVYLAMYVLLALLLSTAGVWLRRVLHRGRRAEEVPVNPMPVPLPDLTDDGVTADELSEDRWTSLAKELLARGETRLGLRALYLASLSLLAERGFLTIVRSKSNREYERELRRRGHAVPGLAAAFADNVTIFDSVWYGMHQVGEEMVRAFTVNHERIVAATGRR